MATTYYPRIVPHREVTDRNGRVYRVGESDVDVMGRARGWMVVLPWLGMVGIGSAEGAFASAQDTFHDARLWSGGQVCWLLGVWVFCRAAVAFPAGRLRESGRLPARTAMVTGALVTLLGCPVAAFAPNTPAACVGFGVCGGVGAGLTYATCVHLVGKWYPERRGGRTGLVDGGFACGAAPFVFVFASVPDPGGHGALLRSAGGGLCLLVAAAGRFFRDPPENWWPPHIDPLRAAGDPRTRRALEKNPPAIRQYPPGEAARTPVLWMMWCCLLCTAGVGVFDLVCQVPFGRDMGFAGGIVATATALAVLVNGAGRGVAGRLSDRHGRRRTLSLVCVVLGTAQFGVLVSGRLGSVPFFLVSSMVAGFGGGAVFPLFAALTADCFGENHNATNHGLVYSSVLVSGLVGSALGAVVVGTRDYHGAFVLAGSAGLACAALAPFCKAPGRPSARRIVPNPHPLGEEMA